MEEIKHRSWFSRNWPWVIPVGGCLTVILIFIFGVGAAFFGISKVMKNATPYEYSVELAKEDIEVQEQLGSSIDTDGIFKGNISIKNNRGEADLEIPIKGSKGKATIIVLANKLDGEWTYEKLYVIIKDTQEEINLLEKTLESI